MGENSGGFLSAALRRRRRPSLGSLPGSVLAFKSSKRQEMARGTRPRSSKRRGPPVTAKVFPWPLHPRATKQQLSSRSTASSQFRNPVTLFAGFSGRLRAAWPGRRAGRLLGRSAPGPNPDSPGRRPGRRRSPAARPPPSTQSNAHAFPPSLPAVHKEGPKGALMLSGPVARVAPPHLVALAGCGSSKNSRNSLEVTHIGQQALRRAASPGWRSG